MPRILPKRKNPVVDMTAMCDVSFLLLTFFILTAKFKPQQAVAVDVPIAHSQKTFTDAITILVDKDGKAYISLKESQTRYAMIDELANRFGDKYPNLKTLTEDQKKIFSLTDTWGTAIENTNTVLALPPNEFKAYQEKQMGGIPFDSLHSQIGDWVQAARYATDGNIKIAIKSDKNTNVSYVQQIVKGLTQRDIHRFLLITTLSGGGEGEAPAAGGEQKNP
ncbi:MAG: biopolymer transporter ExbD [Chitinophagales bacterium]